ncbi:MAG: adenylate/guanylate cyclase domain-containing protein [Pseudomonadota bacterium]
MLLLVGTLLVVFYAVNAASIGNAERRMQRDLDLTARAFMRLIEQRNQSLADKARFLSSDHAYRQIYGFGEREDLETVSANHQRRIKADLMLLLDFSGEALANTLSPGDATPPEAVSHLLATAMASDSGEASTISLIGDLAYQLVMVPLYAPDPVAMVVLGFIVDLPLAEGLKRDTDNTEIALLFDRGEQEVLMAACTLDAMHCAALERLDTHVNGVWDVAGDPYLTRLLPLGNAEGGGRAVLQRSVDAELASYFQLRERLLLIFAVSLVIAMAGAAGFSRLVTRPVSLLVQGVQQIAAGDYAARVKLRQRDELGQLAESFNQMSQGLAERDQVRSLLGKVVSPQIADELMSREIELGGEEIEATILFSDIRDFTSISESHTPQAIIHLLNDYLTEMNAIIEAHDGVVDKYIGDAIMALFGAPLQRKDSARSAMQTGLDMLDAMKTLNALRQQRNELPIDIGIGINTGKVVAGNMGSISRLNYTVLGDAVNLASRLEGLCKFYAVPIIAADSTAAAAADVTCRELDRVRVKGRSEAVTLMQPLQALPPEHSRYLVALQAYREGCWREAQAMFAELSLSAEDPFYAVYAQRCQRFAESPPDADWDGVFTFQRK